MSNRTGKRGTGIRTPDAHEASLMHSSARGTVKILVLSLQVRMKEPLQPVRLKDALSGADQAAVTRQKYPEHVQVPDQRRLSLSLGPPGAELDLHGCHVREALVRVEAFLETRFAAGPRCGPHYRG